MIYFDRKTLKMLKHIKRSKDLGVSWDELAKIFGEDSANPFLLECFSRELYTVTKDEHGSWIEFDKKSQYLSGGFRSFTTPKANELIERLSFDFWKWTIPTLISVSALVISVLTALTS